MGLRRPRTRNERVPPMSLRHRMPKTLVRARAALAVAVPLLAGAQSAAAAGFTAQGSAKQVYVTGLNAGQRMSLVTRAGRVLATQRADSLGGLLFRNVAPGSG